jgi:hypothetical protein
MKTSWPLILNRTAEAPLEQAPEDLQKTNPSSLGPCAAVTGCLSPKFVFLINQPHFVNKLF